MIREISIVSTDNFFISHETKHWPTNPPLMFIWLKVGNNLCVTKIQHEPFFDIMNIIQMLVLKYMYIKTLLLKRGKISFKCENIQTCFSLNMNIIFIHIHELCRRKLFTQTFYWLSILPSVASTDCWLVLFNGWV